MSYYYPDLEKQNYRNRKILNNYFKNIFQQNYISRIKSRKLMLLLRKIFFFFSGYMLYYLHCLLYTSPSPRDQRGSRMPSSA